MSYIFRKLHLLFHFPRLTTKHVIPLLTSQPQRKPSLSRSMRWSTVLLAFALAAVALVSPVTAGCVVITKEGDRFDFSSLSKEIFIIGMAQAFSNSPSSDPYHSEKLSNSSSSTALTAAALPDERFRLHYRFCDLAPVTPRCTTDKAAFCITPDNSDYVSLARFQTQDDISIAKTIPNGVELEISNLEDDFYGAMTLVITLTCSKAAGEAKSTLVTNNPYHIQFTQQHPAGCPASADSGLSGGWIFIIILLSVSFVYVALGCLYNWKRRGAKLGLEACPQRAMWAACLDNVKAGCLFTKSKVCGGKAGAAGDAGHATYGSQTDTDA